MPWLRRCLLALAVMAHTVAAGNAQGAAPAGARLCSGCHAPAAVGSPVPPLEGRAPEEIVAAMEDYRANRREGTIMGRIAKGFTPDETRAVAQWLGAQH